MRRRAFLVGSLALTGCGALPWIATNGPIILATIQDATIIVDQIAAWVSAYFQAHTDPAKQAAVDEALAKIRKVIDAAAQLLAGGIAATQAQLDQVEKDFTAAWDDLMSLVGPLGVKVSKPGANMMVSEGEHALVVEEPKMLHISKGR